MFEPYQTSGSGPGLADAIVFVARVGVELLTSLDTTVFSPGPQLSRLVVSAS